MIKDTFLDNEIKTNETGVKALKTLILLTFAFVLADYTSFIDIGPSWAVNLIFVISTIICAICLNLKHSVYSCPKTKYLILVLIVLYSGVIYFIFPNTAVFIIYGPIVISIRYYNRRFTLNVSIIEWIVYATAIALNVVLDSNNSYVHDLHLNQNMLIWAYPQNAILYLGLVRTAAIELTTFIAIKVVESGNRMIIEHSIISKKASLLEAEISAAAKIQSKSMPASDFMSDNGNVKIHAGVVPARETGGDFYDCFMVDEDTACFLVADVSDKGISAAMFSMRVQSAVRYVINDMAGRGELDLALAVSKINELLICNNSDDMFVTLWIACIDTRSGLGKYVNAGHVPPFRQNSNNRIVKIETEPQLFLGMFKNVDYKSYVLKLHDGDSLVLFTDGITDSRSILDESFGTEGLLQSLNSANSEIYRDPKLLYSHISDSVNLFSKGAERFDDETVMVINFLKSEKPVFGSLCIDGHENSIPKAMKTVNEILSSTDCPEDVRRDIDVVIDEICVNILDYGNQDNDLNIKISYEIGINYIIMEFSDNGIQFNPLEVEFDENENQLPKIGGLGIHIVSGIADEIKYRFEQEHNILTVTKLWGV